MLNMNLSNNIIKEDSEGKNLLGLNIPTADIINEEDERNLDVVSNVSRLIENKLPEKELEEEKEHNQTSASHEKCIKFSFNLI